MNILSMRNSKESISKASFRPRLSVPGSEVSAVDKKSDLSQFCGVCQKNEGNQRKSYVDETIFVPDGRKDRVHRVWSRSVYLFCTHTHTIFHTS
jgi:hypothetical protein